jgi:pimeloyl-ACP methyl ester carboxylesterase
VPGFRENFDSRDYKITIDTIKSRGYKVVFIHIDWNRTTLDNWVVKLEQEYCKLNQKDVILAGFSFGAMTALYTASKRQPRELWLFSLSPYFKEDLSVLKNTWRRYIGKHRIISFSKVSFDQLVETITCTTLIFVGEKEAKLYPSLNLRAIKAKKLIKHSRLIIVPDCGHDVCDKRYVSLIKKNIMNLQA